MGEKSGGKARGNGDKAESLKEGKGDFDRKNELWSSCILKTLSWGELPALRARVKGETGSRRRFSKEENNREGGGGHAVGRRENSRHWDARLPASFERSSGLGAKRKSQGGWVLMRKGGIIPRSGCHQTTMSDQQNAGPGREKAGGGFHVNERDVTASGTVDREKKNCRAFAVKPKITSYMTR